MKTRLLAGCILSSIILTSATFAVDMPPEFSDPAQQQRYSDLIKDLRCLVCQNQSLADSNAPLAQDLRLEIYRMFSDGENNEDIIKYLVARYGDFVLYRPPFKSTTYLLWLGPVIFLIIGMWIAASLLRKQQVRVLNEEEKKYVDKLLNDDLPGSKK